jgi:hypothetical protein
MKPLLFPACLLIFCVTVSGADIPDCGWCEFSDCSLDETGCVYLCPDGPADQGYDDCPEATITMDIVNDASEPLAGAVVEIMLGGQASGHIQLCPDQTLMAMTDNMGHVAFNIAGGGCYKGVPEAVVVRVNGMVFRTYDSIMSADYAYADNEGIPGGGDLHVDPVDLAAFAEAYQGGAGPRSCHDYNNSWTTDPTDLAVFVSAYRGGVGACQ